MNCYNKTMKGGVRILHGAPYVKLKKQLPVDATYDGNVLKAYIEENYELYIKVCEAQELGLIG